jgi:hypothetical protein
MGLVLLSAPTGVPHLPASGPLAGVLDAVASGLAEHTTGACGRLVNSAGSDRLAICPCLCTLPSLIPHDCTPLSLVAGLAA